MTFERDYLGMMPQSITYQAYSGISTDGYGAITVAATSAAKTVKCRIQPMRIDVMNADTREVQGSTFKVIAAPYSTSGTSDTVTVSVLDKITLPTGFIVAGSCSPPILKAYPVQDEEGHHHNEVWF